MTQKNKKIKYFIVVIVILVGAALGYFAFTQIGKDEFLVNKSVMSTLPSCDESKLLSVAPIASADLTGIGPMGNINAPGGHVFLSDHTGLSIKKKDPGAPIFGPGDTLITSVIAPADVHIFGIRKTDYIGNGQATYSDYGIAFSNCKGRTFYFNHIGALSQKLDSTVSVLKSHCNTQNGGGSSMKACDYQLDYPAKSGEVIASVGGRPNTFGIDFGSFDTNKPALAFIHTKHMPTRNLYAQCPFDYFVDSIKVQLYTKFANQTEPRCGQVVQDKLGTIMGNWYVKGKKESDWNAQLAVLHDTTDKLYNVISIGGTVGTAREVGFVPSLSSEINHEPSAVTPDGKIYCYSASANYNGQGDKSGSVILQLLDAQTMKVEVVASSCSDKPSFQHATTYIR